MTRYNLTINRLYLLGTVVSALVIVFALVGVVYYSYQDFQTELRLIGQNYIKAQKNSIYLETHRALRYIKHKYQSEKEIKPLEQIQKEIVDVIENLRNERDGTGYIFIYDEKGINIADPILKQNAGKNMLDFTDPNGKKVIYELIVVSKEEDGGYVEYVWNKPIENTLAPKVSYAIFFQPLGWMIGSGVYLDNIQKEIAIKKQEYRNIILNKALWIIVLSSILFLLMIIIYRYVTHKIKTESSKIEELFLKASKDYDYIDEGKIMLFEFRAIIKFANEMIKVIRLHKEELENLNLTLEQRVETKTKKLQTAKEFTEKLLANQEKFIKNSIHEINTPLSIILTNIDLYKMKNEDNRYITNIEAGVKIVHNIYNDLSFLIKKDIVDYKSEIINLSEFLKERIEFFEDIIRGNLLKLSFDIDDEVFVEINATVLQRLIDNNISNAIKYSLSKKEIQISLKLNNDKICLTFENYAHKIENTNNLFERFYRENESRGGFGIGLNLVKEICDKNQIQIDVTSDGEKVKFIYVWREIIEHTTA